MSGSALALSAAITACRARGELAVLAEIKAKSAGGEQLLRDRDPADIARAYVAGGASALSVVTGRWFGGSTALLEAVVGADLGVPVLRKDFIRNDKAIAKSRELGASAVLLTRALAPDLDGFVRLVDAARAAGLEPFVEVASAEELDEVAACYDGLIAINNANIADKERSGDGIARSLALRERAGGDARVWVSASTIAGPDDVAALRGKGFDGVLVGTHLMAADDPQAATAALVAAAKAPA